LRQYQREWDDDKKVFRDRPKHDWTSHSADAFRYLSLVWKDEDSPILKDSNVKGLHVGGFRYVQSYASLNCQLLECFVDPAEIGAICDLNEYSGGAIRVKEYLVYGAVKGRTKGIYHSSTYAKMKDEEWEAYKLEAVKAANELLDDIQAGLDNLGK